MVKETTVMKDLAPEEYKRVWESEKDFKVLKNQHDKRFGDISILKNDSTGQVIFKKEKICNSKKDATNMIHEIKKRMGMNSPNLLKLLGYEVSTQKKLCSTHFLIKQFFQYPNTDGRKLLSDKIQAKQRFSGDELEKI